MSCINVQAGRVGGISLNADRVGGIISLSTERNYGISVSAGIVCEVQLGRYLRVTPTEVQWITLDTSIDYNVLSNTIWSVN